MGIVPATLILQATGTLLVAALLMQLRRGLAVRFLGVWSASAVALAGSVTCVLYATEFAPEPISRTVAFMAYACGSYLSVFLFWSGIREFITGQRFSWQESWRLAPWMALGLTLPLTMPTLNALLAIHFPAMAVLMGLALQASWPSPSARHASVGLPLTRMGLILLIALFMHNGIVLFLCGYFAYDPLVYVRHSPIYDAIAQLVVVFGAVLLATEQVRTELETKNEQLADAARQLAEAARTDPLTGLLNRRALDEIVAGKRDQDLRGSVAVLDVNDLKVLNDQHGHLAGDAALKLVARAVSHHFRVTDPIFRTGGDEFVVLMLDCTAAELSARLERIDQALQGQRIPSIVEPRDLAISWGVAEFDSSQSLEPAMQQADDAMYACKRRRKAAGAVVS